MILGIVTACYFNAAEGAVTCKSLDQGFDKMETCIEAGINKANELAKDGGASMAFYLCHITEEEKQL